MQYLHKQQPADGIWHNETIIGVPITLTALDSNGNVLNIGKATTNGYFGTFSLAWTPPHEGTYEIMASFAADDSYGSSAAATSLSIGQAMQDKTDTVITNQPTVPVEGLYAVAAAIVILGVILAAVLLFKKKI